MAEVNWLEQVKLDAEKITLRRLEDDGLDLHAEREQAINDAEAKTASPTSADKKAA